MICKKDFGKKKPPVSGELFYGFNFKCKPTSKTSAGIKLPEQLLRL
jgi:hypothetical protein